jgi:general L-amino acid transport system permease protein
VPAHWEWIDEVNPVKALWRNPTARAFLYQALVLAGIAAVVALAFVNATVNLRQRGVTTGFSFLFNEAGLAVSETSRVPVGVHSLLPAAVFIACYLAIRFASSSLMKAGPASVFPFRWLDVAALAVASIVISHGLEWEAYGPSRSFVFALATGFLNSLKVAFIAAGASILLGFLLGACQLSTNRLLATLVNFLTETVRNVPLLLVVLFSYATIINVFPPVRQSWSVGDVVFFSNRGLFYPTVEAVPLGAWLVSAFLMLACAWYGWRHRQRSIFPIFGAGCLILPVIGAVAVWSVPSLGGFNFTGGASLSPEYTALLAGLIIYYSAFISDVVRSALRAVPAGQWEGSFSIGLNRVQTIRLVVVPQAMRMIVPPLTNIMLGLTKDTSIGVAIAFPEITAVGRSIINQTGQSLEVMLIIMAVFVALNLVLSNSFERLNRRFKLKQN